MSKFYEDKVVQLWVKCQYFTRIKLLKKPKVVKLWEKKNKSFPRIKL